LAQSSGRGQISNNINLYEFEIMVNTSTDFVHLHVHTQYSLLDGAIRIESLIDRALGYGMPAVAITDHGTMFGAIEFYEKVRKAGLKPIIGCECYVAPRTLTDKTPLDHKGLTHLILLAENMQGYHNLCRMVSLARIKGFYHKPRIDKDLLRNHHQGLIALSACLHGEIPQLIRHGTQAQADQAAHDYVSLFGQQNFFLEVQNNGIEKQELVNDVLYDMSQRLGIPLVATNDCHYLDQDHVTAHDTLLCVQTGKTIHDTDRLKFRTDQLFFKSQDLMQAYFSDHPDALANTIAIADRCQVDFDFDSYHFPKFDTGNDLTEDELFERMAQQGYAQVKQRIRAKQNNFDETLYRERLEHEIATIKKMGFAGYFLIVSDFIRYAKDNDVPVGPGRGSAAGSLVAYSLGITDLDPIEHGLIFERFLNPARKSMPDIDVDFCINGREKIFKYVVAKYGGGERVAQIITFGKLKTRAVIRDVGRALDIPLHEVDVIAKLVPDVLNISLDEALKQEPRLRAMADQKPEIADLINISRVLEGLPRHASTHAAGVVISDKPLVEYLPLYTGKKDEVITQFDMKIVEKIGLVKFDFLGLRNLTVIANTLKLIARQDKKPPNMDDLDLTDDQTYQLLTSGDTTGVFQLESSGMKDLLMRLKPECFDDVIALVALYRPGPLDSGMVDDFVQRKHGKKKVAYLLPQLAPILKETYGVIVYQEQVMKIAAVVANYSMAEADDLRKAMGKKIHEILAQHRKRFVRGAVENQVSEDKAESLFSLIEKFGGYGFNKSHSAAYALIAYQTAYLKTHFQVEFLAALLTSEMHSTDGVVKFIAECRSHDIPVLPPDINESDKEFIVSGSQIRFGLVAVKNVGESAIEAMIQAREEGPFTSLFEFCERVDLRKVNKRVVESLIKSGAFDSTGARRSQMFAAIEDALEYGQQIQRERNDPQMGLFDMGDQKPSINRPTLSEINEWTENQLLSYEKESLGFYITGHPLNRHEALLTKFANANAVTIREIGDGAAVRIGGIIRQIKVIKTKRGDLMAFVTIEDMHGSVEATIFSSLYERVTELLVEDRPIFVEGQVQKDEQALKILAETLVTMEEAEATWTASVHLKLDMKRIEKSQLIEIKDILLLYPGSCQGFIHLAEPEKTETVIALPETMKLRASAGLTREINRLLGYRAIETRCQKAKTAGNNHNSFNPNRKWKR